MLTVVAGAIRHLLTWAGGGAVLASDNEITQVAGAVVSVIGFLWSVIPKVLAARKSLATS